MVHSQLHSQPRTADKHNIHHPQGEWVHEMWEGGAKEGNRNDSSRRRTERVFVVASRPPGRSRVRGGRKNNTMSGIRIDTTLHTLQLT
jgi:hypothetical protein